MLELLVKFAQFRIPRITSVEIPGMPSDSDFLVGTTLGGVLRLERTFAVSHQYSAELGTFTMRMRAEHILGGVCDVLSLRMSPFDPNVFAVRVYLSFANACVCH